MLDEPRLHTGTWEDPLTHSTHPDLSGLRLSGRTLGPQRRTQGPTQPTTSTTHIGKAPRAISGEDNWGSSISEHELSSDEESDRSAGSSTRSNGQLQLRSTLNKARTLCDKWRGSVSGNVSHSASTHSSQVAPTPSGATAMASSGDPSHPGDSPGGRLSRWFSIRRGSAHQYDVGGGVGCGNPTCGDERDSAATRVGGKMPQLPEVDEDPVAQSFHNHSCSSGNPFLLSSTGSTISSSASSTFHMGGTGQIRERRAMPPSLPPEPPNLSPQQLKRRHVIASIVHSENGYVATLQRLVNDYKKPLEESSPPILSASKISILFHRLPEILQCHTLFRIALAENIRLWDRDEKIGDVFVASFSKAIVLDIYSGFINNFSVAMDLAKMESKRKSALADFFKVKQISAHDRLSFFGLMVKPVQRFPQFIMFLQDLLKYTPQGHHDRMSLQLALTQLESLAEMLNERKREAEQCQGFREMLGHITGAFNVRTLSDANRYLIREDNVTQLEYNQNGMITKSKSRRLLLLNDRVVCVSVAPKQSHDFGATEKLSFKWMYPVTDVEIQDNSASLTLSRILTAGLNRGGSLKSNSSTGNGLPENGADTLCSEMSNLMHDYEVMSRINDLVGTLKGSYNEMTTENTRRILNNIQGSIQRKDEEMAWVDSCCLQLVVRTKSAKGGKEETFTFQTEDPAVKREWLTELRLAQLALDTNNSPAWEVPEQEQRPTNKTPLFVRAQCVYKSQHQTEVRCGCFYNAPAPARSRRRGRVQSYLWVCTNDGASSHIAVLAQHPQQSGNLRDVGAFHLVETQVTTMEFVKGANPGQPLGVDSVWMGTDSRRLLLYAAVEPEREEQIAHTTVPGVITQIRYHCDSVFVALGNGSLLIYRRGIDNTWLLKEPQALNVGVEPVASLLTINTNLYAACGKKVWVLNGFSGEIFKSFSVQDEQFGNINLMAHSGIGLWISLKNSSTICLYHTETFKHLQDINIASNVVRVTTSSSNGCSRDCLNNNSAVSVTALLACKGLLWVGTNVGISLTIPLPRLEGVPIISGRVNISYHAHFGPILFLLPLQSKNYILNTPKELERTPEKIKEVMKTEEPEKAKLEKQLSDSSMSSVTAKLRQQLTNSPVVLRRRRSKDNDMSRMSKTLPRSLGTGLFSTSTTSSQGSGDTCDVYGLYGELMYIKDYEEGDGTLGDAAYESLRRSDPELAAIPGKVSTLDRRLRMKVSRPRSLDLSNWSVDSRSSSLYTSSGSEESMALRNGRSVSRNNSNSSRTITLNNGANEIVINIQQTTNPILQVSDETVTITPVVQEVETKMAASTTNLKVKNNKNKSGKLNNNTGTVDTRRTIITLMGGRGYVNWRQPCCPQDKQRAGPNTNDAHIVIWEKKL